MRNPLHLKLWPLHFRAAVGIGALGIGSGLIGPSGPASIARAEHPWHLHIDSESSVRLARTLGIGWSDGYHACRANPAGRRADLPPTTYYASPAVHPQDASSALFSWLLRPIGASPDAHAAEKRHRHFHPVAEAELTPPQSVAAAPQPVSNAPFPAPSIPAEHSRPASLRPRALPKPATEVAPFDLDSLPSATARADDSQPRIALPRTQWATNDRG